MLILLKYETEDNHMNKNFIADKILANTQQGSTQQWL